MKISIITISFNAKATIEKTLKSIATQSFMNIEHIIVDGGSKDNTLEICNSFPHISKIISEPDNGVYDAFNKGLKVATGDVVGFLNSDDVFYNENSVQEIANAFLYNDVDIAYGNLDYINQENREHEVEEITENIFILVTHSKQILGSQEAWNPIKAHHSHFITLKTKDYPSLSNRCRFKYMDM